MQAVRRSLTIFVGLGLITGIIYPLLVTGLAQLCFTRAANGSLLQRGSVAVGSDLIGQPFSGPNYFWSRPSATVPFPYNAAASTGSNHGPLNPSLAHDVSDRLRILRAADPSNPLPVPVDLVTASGSGLDPHISVAAALYQIDRVARARGINPGDLRTLLARQIEGRQFGFLGEPRVNVLELNLALDAAQGAGGKLP
jgi:K+-transporting ATPase ATPase C chain